jgi:hypothetical protein
MTEHTTSQLSINKATQREAPARTDARSDHAVLDLFGTFCIKAKSTEQAMRRFVPPFPKGYIGNYTPPSPKGE